jgi:hypothetical protein
VAGYDAIREAGGFGAALLFAAAGGVGAWAAGQVPLPRLAAFAALFAMLGVSFNLALHPVTRPLFTADILQGLALCALAVACWRRWFGAGPLSDSALVALPLLAHVVLGPLVPSVPGLHYLFDGRGGESLFPLFPWLTVAALGARASGETAAVNAVIAALFGAAAAALWWSDPRAGVPVKFPMNLSYALLSCASAAAAVGLAQGLARWGPAARGLGWLGRRWLVFFYVHFAVVAALNRMAPLPPWAVWALLAAGALAGTWLVAAAAAPLAAWFRRPAPWGVLAAVIVAAGVWPGLDPAVVTGVAGLAGLVFAAHYGLLAYVVANAGSLAPPVSSPSAARHEPTRKARKPAERSDAPDPGRNLGRDLARFAAVLALLSAPEVVGWVSGADPGVKPGRGRPPARPPRRSVPGRERTLPLPPPTRGAGPSAVEGAGGGGEVPEALGTGSSTERADARRSAPSPSAGENDRPLSPPGRGPE